MGLGVLNDNQLQHVPGKCTLTTTILPLSNHPPNHAL